MFVMDGKRTLPSLVDELDGTAVDEEGEEDVECSAALAGGGIGCGLARKGISSSPSSESA